MELKNVKVWDSTKYILKTLKVTLRFKSEAEVISYLISVYNDNWHKLSLEQDANYRQQVEHEKNGRKNGRKDEEK